jgi:mono/diheme cytochrome c family protein
MRWLEPARAISNQREICFSPRTHGRSSLMKSALLLIAALSCCAVACKRSEKVLTVKTATLERKIPLSELITTFGASDVTVDDYYLKRRVTYRALPLAKMLARFAAEFSAYDEFIFRCADGYLAHVSRADFEAGKLDSFALAFGEGSEVFRSKIPQGKAELSPEPFYAVATDPAGFQTLSWPYEVIAIELVNFRAMFPALYFEGMQKDISVAAGFSLFRKECLKCHSLNLQGGDIGPELNVPQNVTQYRDAATLKKFIRNASQFRARSKMPPYEHLSDKQIEDILSYLRAMAGHKAQ